MKLVNIYNKGIIPWMNIRGPVYKIQIGDHVYQLLARDPRVDIELYSEALARKEREAAAKIADVMAGKDVTPIETIPDEPTRVVEETAVPAQPEAPKITVGPLPDPADFPPVEEIPEDAPPVFEIIETAKSVEVQEVIEDTDAAIEAVLDEYENIEVDSFEVDMSNLPEKEVDDGVKKYTRVDLEGMTKAQMKQILIERGYTDGEFAPRYHDSVGKLIGKVLSTQ